MANNYLQFSEVLENLTPAEEAWLQEQLEPIAVVDGVTWRSEAIPDEVDSTVATFEGPRFLENAKDIELYGDEPNFQYEFHVDEQGPSRGKHLWFYSEEYGCVQQVAILVQQFLRKFRPRDIWTLTYACTCSKPRVSEFGGGAVLVTAKKIRWHDADAIACEAKQSHSQRQAVKA